jgi:hypothetical protein
MILDVSWGEPEVEPPHLDATVTGSPLSSLDAAS